MIEPLFDTDTFDFTSNHATVMLDAPDKNTYHSFIRNIVSTQELPLLLSVADVVNVLKIGRNTAYTLLRSGQLKSIRVGRLIKIPRSALEEYLQNY